MLMDGFLRIKLALSEGNIWNSAVDEVEFECRHCVLFGEKSILATQHAAL